MHIIIHVHVLLFAFCVFPSIVVAGRGLEVPPRGELAEALAVLRPRLLIQYNTIQYIYMLLLLLIMIIVYINNSVAGSGAWHVRAGDPLAGSPTV